MMHLVQSWWVCLSLREALFALLLPRLRWLSKQVCMGWVQPMHTDVLHPVRRMQWGLVQAPGSAVHGVLAIKIERLGRCMTVSGICVASSHHNMPGVCLYTRPMPACAWVLPSMQGSCRQLAP